MTMAGPGITRDRAMELLNTYIPQENLKRHCIASEAVMRMLAVRLDADQDTWGLAGLLHDLDYNETKDDMSKHGLVTASILEKQGVSNEIISAIKAHNAENTGFPRRYPIDFALTAGETITGLIVAVTLVYPDKKITSVRPRSIVKRMKEKGFARGVSREKILLCSEIGMEIGEFATLCLKAMTQVGIAIGLA